jgi:hypothetical protein
MALKKTSSEVQISSRVAQTALNTFNQVEVDLSLSPLDNEIFVVTGLDMDTSPPDFIAGLDTDVQSYVSTTSQTGAVGINNSNVVGANRLNIKAAGSVDSGVGFTQLGGTVPTGDVMAIAYIATNNFFVGLDSTNCATLQSANCRLYGYRARADAATYAALVSSEVLSA